MAEQLRGSIVAIVIAEGVNASEVMRARYRLQELGARVHLIGADDESVRGTDGATFPVEAIASEVTTGYYDGILVPSALQWRRGQGLRDLVSRLQQRQLPVAVVGDGVRLAAEAGLLEGRTVSAPAALAREVERAGGERSDRAIESSGTLISAADGRDIDALCEAFATALAARRIDLVEERSNESFPGSDPAASGTMI